MASFNRRNRRMLERKNNKLFNKITQQTLQAMKELPEEQRAILMEQYKLMMEQKNKIGNKDV
jgi:hypothetical protein